MSKIRSLKDVYKSFYFPKEILENKEFLNCTHKKTYNYPSLLKGISVSNRDRFKIELKNTSQVIDIYSFCLDLNYSKNNGYDLDIFVSIDKSSKEAQIELFNYLIDFYLKEEGLSDVKITKQFNSFDKQVISLNFKFRNFKDLRTFDFNFFTFQQNINLVYFDTYPKAQDLPRYLSEEEQQQLYDDLYEIQDFINDLNKEDFCKLLKNISFEEGKNRISDDLNEHLILLYKQ